MPVRYHPPISFTTTAAPYGHRFQNFDDVLKAMQLLTHLISKDFIDYSAADAPADTDALNITSAVFSGLSTILPFVTPELLKIPELAIAFFALVGYLASDYAERFAVLDTQLFLSLTTALEYGFKHLDSQIARESLRGVEGLVSYHFEEKKCGRPGLDAQLQAAAQPHVANSNLLLHWLEQVRRLLLATSTLS